MRDSPGMEHMAARWIDQRTFSSLMVVSPCNSCPARYDICYELETTVFAMSHFSKYEFLLQVFLSFSVTYFKHFVANFIM